MKFIFILWIYTISNGFTSTESVYDTQAEIYDPDITAINEWHGVSTTSEPYVQNTSDIQSKDYLEDNLSSESHQQNQRWNKHKRKQIKQRRKKQKFRNEAENTRFNETVLLKPKRRRLKKNRLSTVNKNSPNHHEVTTVIGEYEKLLDTNGDNITTSKETYTEFISKKGKSRKYGQGRKRMQPFQQQEEFNSPGKPMETSSVKRGRLQRRKQTDKGNVNQKVLLFDSKVEQQEIKEKIKFGRGKRREKVRLKDKDKELNYGESVERRKILQEKREKKRRRKLERMENRRQNAENQLDNKKKNQKVNKNETISSAGSNFMAPPSIDYFIEKSSNYVDPNESPPLEVIAVSIENPSKNIMSQESEAMNSSEMLQKLPTTKDNSLMYNVNNIAMDENIIYNGVDSSDEIIGDLSCLKDNFKPAPEVPHADVKYLRNEEKGSNNPFLEVEYICHRGYKLQFNDSNKNANIYCKNSRWIGIPPSCIRVKDFEGFNKTCSSKTKCNQQCYVRNGVEKCICHKGFRMKENGCEDINECAENPSACEFGCINTIGSYRCKCPKGLRAGDNNNCIDINECLLRNSHGPCQDTCKNIWGSYKCSCDNLPGTQLSPDGHSCVDIDECSANNGGCSHTCLDTMGRAFCLCPEGWTLGKDWKTCVDIDECAEPIADSAELRCEFGCINTPGSYSCLVDIRADQPVDDELEPTCPDGFFRNSSSEDCQDVNECAENNGGCFHSCVNTIGSFYCSCQPGFVFAPDKYNCIVINSSTDISCPPLFPPKHGYLECSRPIASDIIGTDANGLGGRRRITNRPGSQCVLRCPTGFRINGKFSKQCSTSGIWVGEGNGTCIRYPTPKLICPSDIVVETPPNETMAKLKIPRPKTDVNYDRDVFITPEWMRNSEIALEIGIRNVTYTARHPVSKLTVSCWFKITVMVGEPPVVKFCPQTLKYALNKHYESIKISWNEPIFWDNVNVTEISRTNNPGNSFGVGSHQIVYIARDHAGYTAKCIFKILVNVPYRPTLNHPLPIYHMFYK